MNEIYDRYYVSSRGGRQVKELSYGFPHTEYEYEYECKTNRRGSPKWVGTELGAHTCAHTWLVVEREIWKILIQGLKHLSSEMRTPTLCQKLKLRLSRLRRT